MLCSSCDKQRKNLHVYKSKVSGTNVYMCQTCIDHGFEPRFLLLLVGRESGEGLRRVAPYIRARKYVGEDIKAIELL
jgi:hypothetical protein